MLMSGEMSEEKGRELTRKEKFDVWMVNEGYRRLFVFTFAILHVMVFVFGMMNYGLKVRNMDLAQERLLTSHRTTRLAHEPDSVQRSPSPVQQLWYCTLM